MRRNIVHDKINTAYENRKNDFRMTSFEEILNYFKLRNGWLNSKLCASANYCILTKMHMFSLLKRP